MNHSGRMTGYPDRTRKKEGLCPDILVTLKEVGLSPLLR